MKANNDPGMIVCKIQYIHFSNISGTRYRITARSAPPASGSLSLDST